MGLLSTIGAASGRAFGLTRVGAAIRDAYFNLTTLLLPGNGTNGAQNNTFLDSSTNNFTITRNGNTTQGTFSPFSQTGWSNFFDGNGDFLTSSHPDMNATWTIETWIYRNSGGVDQCIATMNNGGFSGVFIFINTSNYIEVNNGVNATSAFTNVTVPVNAWTHIAVVRSGGTTTGYINGVVAGSNTFTPSTVSAARIGHYHSGGPMWFNGYMSNFRVVNGTAVYTSAFTPPTSPLTAITNTSLLTCQSNRFIDNSSNAYTITRNGDVSVQAFSPFAPTAAYSAATVGGSGYFDGSGDSLAFATGQSALALGSSDFTFEAWVYRTTTSTSSIFVGQSDLATGAGSSYGFLLSSSVQSDLYSGSGGYYITSPNPAPNQWVHVAWARTGGTYSSYLNGSRVGTIGTLGTASINTGSATYPPTIGSWGNGSNALTGYIAGARLIKGSGGYDATQSTITIPTAPPTAVANTSFLLNFTNAGITDATAKNDLETVGNAQISTTQSKFGGSSIYLDGNGDYLIAPYSQISDFGTGDFTVEFWMNASAAGTYVAVVGTQSIAGSGTAGMWRVVNRFNSANGLYFAYTTGSGFVDLTFSTTNYNDGTWRHIAVTRASGSLRAFVDGTQVGSTTSVTQSLTSGQRLNVGWNAQDGQFYQGYIDDLRITRGYARYTSNFTPPTAALPLQ